MTDADCGRCDAAGTLETVAASAVGRRIVYCTCCGQTSFLDEHGRLVPVIERDQRGEAIDGP